MDSKIFLVQFLVLWASPGCFEVDLNVLQAIVEKPAGPNWPDVHRICVRI
jgi:hypothetical protein